MRRRDRIRRELERVRHRIAKLVRAEKNRDAVTAKRKRKYREARDRYGDDDARTRHALRRFRASRDLSDKIDQAQAVLRRRAHRKLKFLHEHPPPLDPDGDGLIQIDGVQVSEGVGREVLRIRKAGRWHGIVVSGFRTPEHSENICRGMCGAPQCPGRCAGRATRHAKKGGRDGAVDVTDFITFAAECRRLGSWLENHLPKDLVHFSDIGN
jgi:hypothetical protein